MFVSYLNSSRCKELLINDFSKIIKSNLGIFSSPPTILCIGSDRSTGDSLGPFVGEILIRSNYPGQVIGTIHNPVHAINLEKILIENNYFTNEVVIAVDACLGKADNVGKIYFKKGSLLPGSGVNKSLPKVGDFHILGVVNVSGYAEYLVLQNTRLSLVLNMAEIIAGSLVHAFKKKHRLYNTV